MLTNEQIARFGALNDTDIETCDLSRPCEPWHGSKQNGYGFIWWKGKKRYIHRVVYAASRGLHLDSLDGVEVRHLCHREDCIDAAHIAAGVSQHNSDDMTLAGRQCKGENVNTAKLTAEIVLECRAAFVYRCKTHGARALAKKHGVSTASMNSAIWGHTWAWLPGAVTERNRPTLRKHLPAREARALVWLVDEANPAFTGEAWARSLGLTQSAVRRAMSMHAT